MRITCPQCGFFRDIPDNKVPVTSTMATCPKCRHRFKFRLDREQASRRQEPRAPLPGQEETESSWRRPGPAAARRDATAPPASRFDPEVLPEDDVHEVAPPTDRRTAAPQPLEDEPPTPHYEEPAHFRHGPPDAHGAADDRDGRPVSAKPTRRPLLEEEEDEDFQAPPPRRVRQVEQAPKDDPLPPPIEEAQDPLPPPVEKAQASSPPPDAPRETTRTPQAPEETSAPSPAPAARQEPEQEAAKTPPAGRRSDGVRDIWARLKAMDEDAPKKRVDPESLGDPFDDEESPPREVVTDPIPWERLDAYGFFPGLLLTLKKILLSPAAFFGEMPEGRPKGKALVFNLLISEFLLVLDFLWSLMGLRHKLGAGTAQSEALGAAAATPGLGFLIALLLVPLAIALGIYLDAWLTHLLLLLFRSAKKGFNETFRVMCYSAAPTVLTAIPVAGQILSPIILVWYMAVQAIGLKKVHQGAYTQTLAAIFIKWSLYLFLLLAMLQNFTPGQ